MKYDRTKNRIKISIRGDMKYEGIEGGRSLVALTDTFCEMLEALDKRYGDTLMIVWPTGEDLKTMNRITWFNDHSLEIDGVVYESHEVYEICIKTDKGEVI